MCSRFVTMFEREFGFALSRLSPGYELRIHRLIIQYKRDYSGDHDPAGIALSLANITVELAY